MRVAIFTSVSENISDIAALTVPNKLEYCLRHGYSLIADNRPYDEAVAGMDVLCNYLDVYDLVWTLDADALITNMGLPIHTIEWLGPHITACQEGIVEWNHVNCGSVVWRNTSQARGVLKEISAKPEQWRGLPCGWQTWIAYRPELTVAPLRSFNSCVWNRPANAHDEIGGHWQPGDLVYHPCGVYPHAERLRWISEALEQVQR